MKYAEVIPLLRLPRSLEVFDYNVPTDLESTLAVGQVVLIQFRGRTVMGIVANIKNHSTEATTTIERLLDSDPLIDARTLALLRSFAEDTFVASGLFLRHALPEVPRRSVSFASHSPVPQSPTILPPTIARDLGEKLKEIFTALHQHPKMHVRVDDARVVEPLLLRLAMEAQTSRQSLLILCPLQEHAVALAVYLRSHGVSTICTLPTDAKVKTYVLWKDRERGDALVVVGTRNALFFPMQAGSRYVLIDETAEEWKQSDINPRLDVRAILSKLAAHHEASLLSITPQLSISYSHDRENMTWFDARIHKPTTATITTIPQVTLFSESLISAMEGKRNALFFVHRKGKAALLRCRDCGFTATCPTCDLVLAVHHTFLRCTACAIRQEHPLACSKCKGTKLGTYGVGTEQVEEAAHEFFPNTIITVTTSAFINRWPITEPTPSFDLVAIIEGDTVLHRPDFRSQEKLARVVNRLRQIAAANQAPFIIQTVLPELAVWAAGSAREDQWIREELALRETLHYPPSWRLAKLIIQHKDQTAAEARATNIYTELIKILRDGAIEISKPTRATPPKVRNQYRYLVIVRFKPQEYNRLKPNLTALAHDVIIDLDPTDILR